jgi:hypothetical protein
MPSGNVQMRFRSFRVRVLLIGIALLIPSWVLTAFRLFFLSQLLFYLALALIAAAFFLGMFSKIEGDKDGGQ